MRDDRSIAVIGGANVDIQGFPGQPLKLRDSNPGRIRISVGGVARNIAENTARLGLPTRFFSLVGDDVYGQMVLQECRRAGIDTRHVASLRGATTGTYLSVLDESGDMQVAISDMDIYDQMDRHFVDRHRRRLERSALVVLDTNLPQEVIHHLVACLPDQKLIVDTVSTSKALKIREVLGAFHTIKPNRFEAEALSGIPISDRASLDRTADFFHGKGVRNVFISLAGDGTYYSDREKRGILKAHRLEIVNATGAGDAFIAGLVLGNLRDWDMPTKTRFAIGAALMALAHKDTINPEISEARINRVIQAADIR